MTTTRRLKGECGVRRVKVNGRWCWQARVAVAGARRNRLCDTFEAARQAKAELLAELQQQAGQAEAEASSLAMLASSSSSTRLTCAPAARARRRRQRRPHAGGDRGSAARAA